ncbi:MAG: DUF4337 domain-containing protein [Hyphomicrobiales bacterium]|nr:DUF4337 domain-containing protein [Hyphomicrobiales bacterium]
MSHGVHAVQHEAEHKLQHDNGNAGHGSSDKGLLDSRNKRVALLIAVIALCLAFSETLGKSAQTAAISYNVEASNLWAFFQAKTIRQTVLEAGTELLRLDAVRDSGDTAALKAALAKRIDNWEKTAARYNSELMDPPVRKEVNLNPPYGEGRRELMARAIAAEKRRDTAMERYHHYEVASAAFQIGIVLASATVITGMLVLTYLAAGLGVIGIAFMAIGFFAPHAVHLF